MICAVFSARPAQSDQACHSLFSRLGAIHMFHKSLLAAALLLGIALNATADVTRIRTEDFSVEPGVLINVKINGGPIAVKVGATGQVHVELVQVARTGSEKEADELIARAEPTIEKTSAGIHVEVRPVRYNWSWLFGRDHGVDFRVNIIVPPKVNLILDTSGGPINVEGEIQGDVRADTSGGGIKITGATGKIDLDTSGGAISVDHVVQQVHADTSGGPIHIGYVDVAALDVDADTSGGGIDIGLDPAGNYDVYADTSGGGVNTRDLAVEILRKRSSHLEGRINRGGTRVHADTSGGGINIHAAHP
jgi:hypothetical protein